MINRAFFVVLICCLLVACTVVSTPTDIPTEQASVPGETATSPTNAPPNGHETARPTQENSQLPMFQWGKDRILSLVPAPSGTWHGDTEISNEITRFLICYDWDYSDAVAYIQTLKDMGFTEEAYEHKRNINLWTYDEIIPVEEIKYYARNDAFCYVGIDFGYDTKGDDVYYPVCYITVRIISTEYRSVHMEPGQGWEENEYLRLLPQSPSAYWEPVADAYLPGQRVHIYDMSMLDAQGYGQSLYDAGFSKQVKYWYEAGSYSFEASNADGYRVQLKFTAKGSPHVSLWIYHKNETNIPAWADNLRFVCFPEPGCDWSYTIRYQNEYVIRCFGISYEDAKRYISTICSYAPRQGGRADKIGWQQKDEDETLSGTLWVGANGTGYYPWEVIYDPDNPDCPLTFVFYN